jgi:hypothetical protein
MRNEEDPTPGETGKDIVVFKIRREAECAECGQELFAGRLLRLEKEQPLCLECADLDHLEYLPRGDAAITRRATKYSVLHAVVVQWSRTRKQYERQGILASPEAIRRAEQESLADADLRARRREREAVRREAEDQQFIAAVADAIRNQFPGCPEDEADAIAAHACEKHSGRVGRSAAAKELDPATLRLAVIARIRHVHTNYDQLLGQVGDRQHARGAVREAIDRILGKWEKPNESGAGQRSLH